MLRRELHEILAEVAGYKAGLALSQDQLLDHLSEEEILLGDLLEVVRIRHEHLDEVVRRLLYRLGALRHPPAGGPAIALYAKYHSDPEALRILHCLLNELSACVRRKTTGMPGPVDITPIAERAAADFGRAGLLMFLEFEELLGEHVFGGFMSRFRRTAWKNKEELAGLFQRASITPLHGQFLDQRYVDYLERNPQALDSMHWRNFEALTAEFFAQMGYQVELGAGQGDGGVDVRVWKDIPEPGTPPTMLIQCKRQASKVGQVVVKALWADVVWEGADSGLIVTTSALEPGAAKVVLARGYDIHEADRTTVIQWLKALRSPGIGIPLI